ncbi:hypothetical protein ACPXBC_31115, partial [Escherichia coli]|uniref:hypothetical protein n=1 Tax=Escherichia coli TaxID=562 RepID=UPI003CE50239
TAFMLAALVVVAGRTPLVPGAPLRLTWRQLLLTLSFMLLAMFTKENGVVLAPFIVAAMLAPALGAARRLSRSEVVLA